MRKIKEIIIYILIFFPVSNGFYVQAAKSWTEKMLRVLTSKSKYGIRSRLKALKSGYSISGMNKFGKKGKARISERDYYYLQPINGTYTKWMDNKIITRKIFCDFDIMQKLYYQVFSDNTGSKIFPLEDCDSAEHDAKAVLEFIRGIGKVAVTEPRRYRNILLEYRDDRYIIDGKVVEEDSVLDAIAAFHKRAIIAEYIEVSEEYSNANHKFGNMITVNIVNRDGNTPLISDAMIRVDDCYTDNIDIIKRRIEEYYDIEYRLEKLYPKETKLETRVFYNTDALEKGDEERLAKQKYFTGIEIPIEIETGRYNNGFIASIDKVYEVSKRFFNGAEIRGAISNWESICAVVKEMCRHVPQLEFFSIDIIITEDGFRVIPFINVPAYPDAIDFSDYTMKYLIDKLNEKRGYNKSFSVKIKKSAEKVVIKLRLLFTKTFFPKGLKSYLSIRWIKEVIIDLITNKDVKFSDKIWAYRHGFLSYRLPQYGITRENHLDYISDFEYKWLRHINGSYKAIFEDKITVKYIVNRFKECFPDYYYHIKTVNNENVIIPMMDCPVGYGSKTEDIFDLVKEKGVLALKPDEGSHGDGFYRFSYENGAYYLNFDKVDKQRVLDVITNPKNQYLVTEYINNHPQFKEIYSGAVNTIRMIVFKPDGVTPVIGNAYMRFGSKKTGAVDNMGAGGMFVQVDIDTGKYNNAKIITNNSIKDCPYHPDTDVLMEGIIPHWDKIKETVIAVAESIPQLEYFGFDIAVTEDGLKFPEINRFPDYPKIEKFSKATNEYLLQKLEEKKVRYGYDKKPCRKLIHLPKR